MREFLQYIDSKSWLHKCNPESKLLFALVLIFLAFLEWNFVILSLYLLITILIFMSIKPPREKVIIYVRILALLIITTVISQSFFYYQYYTSGKGTILLYILPPGNLFINFLTMGKGIAIVQEGLIYGLKVSLKISVMMFASLTLVLTTKPGEMIKMFNKMGVPISIATATIATIRFIPILIEEIYTSILVLKLKRERIGVSKFFRNVKLILRNVILNSTRRAYILGLSLELRGFTGKKITFLDTAEYKKLNNFILIILVVFAIIAISEKNQIGIFLNLIFQFIKELYVKLVSPHLNSL
ncbi:MAG: energy-coupling factor transporter transmembrane component T family protein [Candidatus Njordarchaeia archaeon]